jgi:hypothetical protein
VAAPKLVRRKQARNLFDSSRTQVLGRQLDLVDVNEIRRNAAALLEGLALFHHRIINERPQ